MSDTLSWQEWPDMPAPETQSYKETAFQNPCHEQAEENGSLGQPYEKAVAAVKALKSQEQIAALEEEKSKLKRRGDGHAETLKAIAAMNPETEGDRMRQWARDGLSGYTEDTDSTLLTLSNKIAALTLENARLRDALVDAGGWHGMGCASENYVRPGECNCWQAKKKVTLSTPPADPSGLLAAVATLQKLACLGNGNLPGNSDGNRIAQAALEALDPAIKAAAERGKA